MAETYDQLIERLKEMSGHERQKALEQGLKALSPEEMLKGLKAETSQDTDGQFIRDTIESELRQADEEPDIKCLASAISEGNTLLKRGVAAATNLNAADTAQQEGLQAANQAYKKCVDGKSPASS